jgi:hypothetical protein
MPALRIHCLWPNTSCMISILQLCVFFSIAHSYFRTMFVFDFCKIQERVKPAYFFYFWQFYFRKHTWTIFQNKEMDTSRDLFVSRFQICVMKYRLYVCVCPCVKADEQREKQNKILQCTGLVYKWGTNTNILKSTLQLHYFVVNMMHNNNIAREFGLAMWVSWLCWKADLVNYSDVPISISVYWITIYLAVP